MTRIGALVLLVLGVSHAQALEIWEIQGSGLRSPYEGRTISTADNTVTAVGAGFFLIQCPDSRTDGDPWTSDGVLVDDTGAPAVEVGDRVTVTGRVVEYYGQTEIGGPVSVSVNSSGNPLPGMVDLDASTPLDFQPWQCRCSGWGIHSRRYGRRVVGSRRPRALHRTPGA